MTKHHAKPFRSGRAQLVHHRGHIDTAIREVLQALSELGYSESSKFAVRLALEEAISNAFRHGHKSLPPETPVSVEWHADEASLRVSVIDKGPGFDPSVVPDPTLEENLEMPSGRGLMLMKAYMTSVTHGRGGNEVTLVYQRPAAKQG